MCVCMCSKNTTKEIGNMNKIVCIYVHICVYFSYTVRGLQMAWFYTAMKSYIWLKKVLECFAQIHITCSDACLTLRLLRRYISSFDFIARGERILYNMHFYGTDL